MFREDQKTWPELEGCTVKTTMQHRDLEPFLRAQGVSQCILLDVQERGKAELIGPYDRFHAFYKEHNNQLRIYHITEMQLRMRLFALEQRFGEAPCSASDMLRSDAYTRLIEHELYVRPELMKRFDEHVATQALYHLEKTGQMPSGQEFRKIQQRVNMACQQFGLRECDKIFKNSLSRDDQKQIQFDLQRQREMER